MRHFEVSLSIPIDVFSELFPILTSQPLQHDSVLRTDASRNCGQRAKSIFATVGDILLCNGCQNVKLRERRW